MNKPLVEMIVDRQPDEARVVRRWSARSAGPVGVTAAVRREPVELGALGALREQQPSDVPQTWADVSKAKKLFGYKPTTSFNDGVTEFYKWQKARSSF